MPLSGHNFPILDDIGPAQRATTAVARFEPFKQAASMEPILASLAWLLGKCAVARADNRVADGTFDLAFEMPNHVLFPKAQAVDHTSTLRFEPSQ